MSLPFFRLKMDNRSVFEVVNGLLFDQHSILVAKVAHPQLLSPNPIIAPHFLQIYA